MQQKKLSRDGCCHPVCADAGRLRREGRPQAEKLAAEAKAKVEAEAKAAEAKVKAEAEALAKKPRRAPWPSRAMSLSAGHHGNDAPGDDQRRRTGGKPGTDGPVPAQAQLSGRLITATSPRRTPIRCTRPPGSMSPRRTWIFSIPDMKGRYALFPMLDGWTNVFQVPGKRTTGTKAQTYTITGPGWTGELPAGVTSTSRRRASSGSSGASTVPAPRRTTRKCTPCRTRSRWCRCRPTASPTRRRRQRLMPRRT